MECDKTLLDITCIKQADDTEDFPVSQLMQNIREQRQSIR